MYQNDAMKVLTGKVRLSYAALTTPRTPQQGGEAKYSVTLLIPKSDVATKADIDAAIQAAAKEGMEKAWKGVRPPMLKVPIHDGDGVRDSGEPFGEECKGHWVMTASSKQRPQVVDQTLSEITNASDIYSGMYARVTIRFFAYANSGNKGIGCGLNNVLKVEDGEPLSGHADAASDFAGIAQAPYPVTGSAPNIPGPAYGYPTQPQYPQYAPQPAAPAYPQQPVYPQTPAQPVQPSIDPITGRPMTGPIMGL
nr:DUF2815 family protein [uncultured Caproiciproducens sp.]